MVAVPLEIGADDGDIEVDGGKSGAASGLSSYGRLKLINFLYFYKIF